MKKLLVTTWMAALTALVGCQQNDELLTNPEAPTTGGKQITVSAHIQNGGGSRVALTETQDENQNPTVKVEWRKDANNPETFTLYQMLDVPATASDETSNDGGAAGGDAGSGDGGASVAVPITFTQVNGTNQFTGTVDENYTGTYEAVYGEGNLALQNGTLNQEDCVYMVAENITDLTHPIEFKHQTAILKVAFKVGNAALNLSDISDIVMRNVTPFSGEKSSTITIIPAAQASGNDVYIFLPASSGYSAGHSFTFGVTTTDFDYYEATLTIPANMSIQKGKLYTADMALTTAIPYVTFSALEEQKFILGTNVASLYSKLEYSVGNGEWTMIPDNVVDSPIPFGGAHGDLRLRGNCENGTADGYSIESNFSIISFNNVNVPVACTGDIRTLVDGENYATANTGNAKFCKLFSGCTQLTSAPALPATNLADGCYAEMFNGCTQLTSAPALPATNLADGCYSYMFYGCESLTSAPALPATVLAAECYAMMFYGCESLTTAPVLPATTLAECCYQNMFQYCSSLTTSPELKVTTLYRACYAGMFSCCSSLTSAPALPATNLAESCYINMFYGCTSLTTAPELPATALAQNCYAMMFRGCTSLTSAPALPATALTPSCYNMMFRGCTQLASAPELPATSLANNCYDMMFHGCTSLTTAPVLPATILAESCYQNMFNGCTNLNSITMLATDITASNCLTYWVNGVAATGTFTKAKDTSIPINNPSGIPTGWTVKSYVDPDAPSGGGW